MCNQRVKKTHKAVQQPLASANSCLHRHDLHLEGEEKGSATHSDSQSTTELTEMTGEVEWKGDVDKSWHVSRLTASRRGRALCSPKGEPESVNAFAACQVD